MFETVPRLYPLGDAALGALVQVIDQSSRPGLLVVREAHTGELLVGHANRPATARFPWVGPNIAWSEGLPPPVEEIVRRTLDDGGPLVEQSRALDDGRLYRLETAWVNASVVMLTLEDVTRAGARRDLVSVMSDVIEGSEDLIVVCAGPGDRCLDLRTVVASKPARARIAPGGLAPTFSDVLGPLLAQSDVDRLDGLLARGGHGMWRVESEGRTWQCRAWAMPGLMGVTLRDIWSQTQMARTLAEQARWIGHAGSDLRLARDALHRLAFRDAPRRMALYDAASAAARLGDARGVERALLRAVEHDQAAMALMEGVVELLTTHRSVGTCDQIPLNDLVDEALHLERHAITRVGATVRRHALPVVWGRWTTLLVLFRHLIRNAVGSPRPGTPLTVTVRLQQMEDRVCVVVEDNGIGIPMAHIDRVFEPMYSVPGRDPKRPGLGLTVCRRIAYALGGDIILDHAPGGGCRVRVLLGATPELLD